MKSRTKGALLGSAAVMIALSGAHAADLPVKAKAVEYVKICSLYGAGFYYIPGSDTCIKLGGYLRVDLNLATNSDFTGAFTSSAGARNRLSNYYTGRARQDLNIDTRTATEYGVLRTYFDATFNWTTDTYTANPAVPGATVYSAIGGGATVSPASGPANASGGALNSGAFGLYYAFIQFAGFTMGKSVSQFDAPWVNYPGNNFDGLVGGGGTVTGVNQFTYTADFGQGITAAFSAQDQTQYFQAGSVNLSGASAAGMIGGSYGSNNIGGSRAPDLVAMVRVDQSWGLFQASVAAHDNHVGYYGATEPTGHPDDKWGWAGQLALSIKNIPTGAGDTLNIQGVYTDGATRYNLQSLANVTYAMYGGTNTAGAYQSLGIASAPDVVYTGTTAATGTSLETIRTWGFRGAYTHNWDPYWNSAIYGAWASINYGSRGTAAICANMVGLLALTGTCNPNFNIAQVGVITRWTPVKNLTFSADLNWTRLDQKYSGTVTAPAAAAVAKPAAVYELKDQDTVTLLLRAQRNF